MKSLNIHPKHINHYIFKEEKYGLVLPYCCKRLESKLLTHRSNFHMYLNIKHNTQYKIKNN